MNPTRHSYIIVTFNNADSIEACLGSIVAFSTDDFEIVVVDNSPGMDTRRAVERFKAAHTGIAVRLIETQSNLGFSRACNLGARHATGDFLFFLNPDTQLLNDAASLLSLSFERQPQTLAAGPAILDRSGRVTRTCRNLPTLWRIALDATGLDRCCGLYRLTRFAHDRPQQVEQIIGAAILVRRGDYVRLGGMDERFFVYFEEVDFCKRLSEAGGQIWFWPEARVQHIGGGSCETNSVRARMIYILRESRRKYFEKHFGIFNAGVLELINRLEGLQKALVLSLLWMIRRRRDDLEKACGFWAVAIGVIPRVSS